MHCPLPIRRCTGPGSTAPGGANAVDERRQQRRVQPAQRPASGTRSDRPTREQVEPLGHGRARRAPRAARATGGCRRRAARPTSPRRRVEALLQRPRLADPARRQRAARRRRGTRRGAATSAVASVRLVVDDDDLADARGADDRGEQRPDPRRLVAGRHDDGDRSSPARRRRGQRRLPPGGSATSAGRRRQQPTASTTGLRSLTAPPSRRSCSATMRAPVSTSGSPPPGWLDPPTRYSPRTGAAVAGPDERGPAPVRRRAVDRPAGGPVARGECRRRDASPYHTIRSRRSTPAAGERVAGRGAARPPRRGSTPGGALTSRNQFSPPAGGLARVGHRRDAGVDRRVAAPSGPPPARRTRPRSSPANHTLWWASPGVEPRTTARTTNPLVDRSARADPTQRPRRRARRSP